MPKRKLSDVRAAERSPGTTPKRPRHAHLTEEQAAHSPSRASAADSSATGTPSRSILKKRDADGSFLQDPNGAIGTPRSVRKVLFTDKDLVTPSRKQNGTSRAADPDSQLDAPLSPLTKARNTDHSARKKSTLRLIEEAEIGQENDDVEAGADIAARVLDAEDINDATIGLTDELTQDADGAGGILDPNRTPTKSRAKTKRDTIPRKKREVTPPLYDLPAHEQYFFQNRPASCKTSVNTLASNALLSHEEFNTHIRSCIDPHADDMLHLRSLHRFGYGQWLFELSQGFNVCLYGYGSKRKLLEDFAEFIWHHDEPEETQERPDSKACPIVIVNGYTHMLTLTDILVQLARNLLPKTTSLPAQPGALLKLLLDTITNDRHNLYLLINSIDAPPLRKPAIQHALARLAGCPAVNMVATADTPNFNLMWDVSLRSLFSFVFHDTTTFEPYQVEIDVVEQVNMLLGKSGRRIGGKDGVSYVLQSLPKKARDLFRILIAEQLAMLDSAEEMRGVDSVDPERPFGSDGEDDDDDGPLDYDAVDEMDLDDPETPSKKGRKRKGRPAKKTKASTVPKQSRLTVAFEGVEVRTLYHKAVEQFACSSEMDFRTLLKEFHDHQMIESRGAGQGTERLLVPFAKEELEGLLESLI